MKEYFHYYLCNLLMAHGMEISMKTNYENLIRNFREYRINYPLTQKELADKTGISLRSITRFENGEDITLSNFIKLVDALDLTENMKCLIPDQSKRPSAYLEVGYKRQRAVTKKNRDKTNKKFKWGDEE